MKYLCSWVDDKLERCFQLLETADPGLPDRWIEDRSDIVEFEAIPALTSAEAAKAVAPRL
jgi:hypothetical protein